MAYNTTDFKGHILIFAKFFDMNIKFCYRYRDYGNNKKYNEVIFKNPTNKSIRTIQRFITANLIDKEYFYSNEWKVLDLHFEDWESSLDHFVHEFDSVEETESIENMNFDIEEFFLIIKNARNYWIL